MLLNKGIQPIIYIKINDDPNLINTLAIGRNICDHLNPEKIIFATNMKVRKLKTELIVYKD